MDRSPDKRPIWIKSTVSHKGDCYANPAKQIEIIVVLLFSFLLSPVTLVAQTGTNDWSRLSSVSTGTSVHEVSKKSATKATLIGLGVGAGVGAAAAIASDKSENDSFIETHDGISAGVAVVAAGIGALTGFLIGRSGKKRVLLYEFK